MNLYEIGILDFSYDYTKSIKVVAKSGETAMRKFLEKFQEITSCDDSITTFFYLCYLLHNWDKIYFANYGNINKNRNLAKNKK